MSSPIEPRVSFDSSRTPPHWIPGEPTATHVINVLQLLPAGERWFVKVLREGLPPARDPELLADVKGLEQFTAVLGDWILAADGLDATGAEEAMLDLLRRLGAEEVEHRVVAFGMYQHCEGRGRGTPRYARRIAGLAVTAPVMPYLWAWERAYLMRRDPQLADRVRHSLAARDKAVRKGLLPAWRDLGAAIPVPPALAPPLPGGFTQPRG